MMRMKEKAADDEFDEIQTILSEISDQMMSPSPRHHHQELRRSGGDWMNNEGFGAGRYEVEDETSARYNDNNNGSSSSTGNGFYAAAAHQSDHEYSYSSSGCSSQNGSPSVGSQMLVSSANGSLSGGSGGGGSLLYSRLSGNGDDEMGLCRQLNRMSVREGDDGLIGGGFQCRGGAELNGVWNNPYVQNRGGVGAVENGGFEGFGNGFGEYGNGKARSFLKTGYTGFGENLSAPALLSGFQMEQISDSSLLFQPSRSTGTSFQQMGYGSLPIARHSVREQVPYSSFQRGLLLRNLYHPVNEFSSVPDELLFAQRSRMIFNEGDGIVDVLKLRQMMHQRPIMNVSSQLQSGSLPYISRMPLNGGMTRSGGIQDINREGSFVLQGDGMSPVKSGNVDCLRRRVNVNGSFHQDGSVTPKGKQTSLSRRSKFSGSYDHNRNHQMKSPFALPTKLGSLAEAQGNIYYMAKDQNGCRELQRVFDEGNPQDIQMIVNEISEHVVELMMNPFGNYLIQKLLDVCTEEQRTQILYMVTEDPGKLARISLNTHGTRVIQKLIDTLTTRQQRSQIISALEPIFGVLIKDLNGNHVIHRCLQCFSDEDNKFIFVASAKYCVDIAINQHGCCVLQKCISHSGGQYRNYLVAEICNNAFLLAQDAYGNYVVQFIIDLKDPNFTSILVYQFRGKYAHLATHKFGSHVVEKCLAVFNNYYKSDLIRELLKTHPFEQLLQDPHANYVIQTAMKVSEGALHNQLVEQIEIHKANSRNSPYAKRFFSRKR